MLETTARRLKEHEVDEENQSNVCNPDRPKYSQ
jgi:hypothetical protein